jgi:hypothetical protein
MIPAKIHPALDEGLILISAANTSSQKERVRLPQVPLVGVVATAWFPSDWNNT